MAKVTNTIENKITSSVNRPGVHAKAKTSSLKTSKNYKKKNVGQGRI
jgi:hypothetical protein